MSVNHRYLVVTVTIFAMAFLASVGMFAQTAATSQDQKTREDALTNERARIEAENKKITQAHRALITGNEALRANRVEEAITQYREGLAARPEEPALLSSLSEALRRRGVERFNAAVKTEPRDASGINAAKKDWTEAATLSTKALEIIKNAPAPADAQQQHGYAQNKLAALSSRAHVMTLVAARVDPKQAAEAWKAFQEYVAVETDPARKRNLRGEALQMLFDAGAYDLAVTEGRRVLAAEPNDLISIRVLGFALFATGDKTKYREAARHIKRYVDSAADTDPLKQSATEILEYLRSEDNIQP